MAIYFLPQLIQNQFLFSNNTDWDHAFSKVTISWILLAIINFSVQVEKLIVIEGGNYHLDFSACSIQNMNEISISTRKTLVQKWIKGWVQSSKVQCPWCHSVDRLLSWKCQSNCYWVLCQTLDVLGAYIRWISDLGEIGFLFINKPYQIRKLCTMLWNTRTRKNSVRTAYWDLCRIYSEELEPPFVN